ncbi:MAG: glutamine-hydrolyzing carbamoyl-phosphate synthase small subunit [Planctomycetota bacterium]|nr:glutamine-hydrolyzing carbamoyl-phosphate synthase small subunit [Planctomycetota bacterium]
MTKIAKLVLEDGTLFTGRSFGAEGEIDGEVVFNTSMTGYQEILTDPSYRGQIVTMTCPEIGNVGTNSEDLENQSPHLAGFIVKENSDIYSNFRADQSLHEFMRANGVIGIEGIDTRALVRKIRMQGAMNGVLSTVDLDEESLIAKAEQSLGLVGRDLVQEVLPAQPADWTESLSKWWYITREPGTSDEDSPHVVALDFGMKWNIARHLVDQGCRVTILPGTSSADEVMEQQPDGVFLSNGPGDPEPLIYAIETIRNLLGRVPIFGICLGHQLLSLASGAKTFKMKFGHRGANHPILNLETSKIEITTQNHGFAVSDEDLPECLQVTHRNLNDNTIAGVRHLQHPAFSVQYHPEASAGPHDSQYLFEQFRGMMKSAVIA